MIFNAEYYDTVHVLPQKKVINIIFDFHIIFWDLTMIDSWKHPAILTKRWVNFF